MRAADFVRSYFDAWNDNDAIAVADHLTDDGVYLSVPENERRTQEELVLILHEFFAAQRLRYELNGEVLEGSNSIAFQYRMFPLVKDRKPRDDEIVRGSEFITLEGDAAVRINDYYEAPGRGAPQSVIKTARRDRPLANKYAKSGLTPEQLADYKAQLESIMVDEQTYLRSDITLPRLADIVGCSVNHLSQVINAGFGVSFFDYVNRYRIEHAKRLLADSSGKENAVLNVAFTVGFNSNSAFYAAFRKNAGETPAQFRREHCAD